MTSPQYNSTEVHVSSTVTLPELPPNEHPPHSRSHHHHHRAPSCAFPAVRAQCTVHAQCVRAQWVYVQAAVGQWKNEKTFDRLPSAGSWLRLLAACLPSPASSLEMLTAHCLLQTARFPWCAEGARHVYACVMAARWVGKGTPEKRGRATSPYTCARRKKRGAIREMQAERASERERCRL